MEGIPCPICSLGGALRAEHVTEARDHQGRTVVIHDVPAFVCDRCGTRVFDETTTRTLEDIYAHAANDRAEMYVVRLGDFRAAS